MYNTDIKFYRFYEKIGKVYIDSFLLSQWNAKGDLDWYTFLKNYAYERQGGNAVYPHIASELVKKWYEGSLTEKDVINEFEEKLNEYKKYKQSTDTNNSDGATVGSNEKRNPLYRGSKKSIMKFISDKNRKSLKEILWIIDDNEWDVKEAYNKITEINGIGQKIASFYLRDLKEYRALKGEEVKIKREDRWYLQPIDIWVRRIINESEQDKGISDKEIAEKIVDISLNNELNPERVNMGMWFFSANIIGNRYKFYLLYKNRKYEEFERCVKDYLEMLDKKLKSLNSSFSL